MRKTTKILMLILIALVVIIMPQYAVQASEAAPAQNVNLEKIEIMSPYTGTYGVGQKIKVVLTYTEDIQALATDNETTSDSISYKFGDNGTVRQSEKGVISGKTLTYEVEIQEEDMGKFIVTAYSISFLKGEETVSKTGEAPEATGNVITADTTPEPDPDPELTWTDFSKAKIELKKEGIHAVRLEISGMTYNGGHNYYLAVSSTKTSPEIGDDFSGNKEGILSLFYDETTGKLYENAEITKYIELNQDIYVCVVERQYSEQDKKYVYNITQFDKKLERFEEPKYTSAFHDTTTLTYNWTNVSTMFTRSSDNPNRKLQIKIGKITDKSILQKIKNQDSSGFSDLLNYAKSHSGIFDETVTSTDDNWIEYNTEDERRIDKVNWLGE